MISAPIPRPSSKEAKVAIGEWYANRFSRNVHNGFCLMYKDKIVDFLEGLTPERGYQVKNEPILVYLRNVVGVLGDKESCAKFFNSNIQERLTGIESILFDHTIGQVLIRPYLCQEGFKAVFREHAHVAFKFLRFSGAVDTILESKEGLEKRPRLMDEAWKSVFSTPENYYCRVEEMITLQHKMVDYVHKNGGSLEAIMNHKMEGLFREETGEELKRIVLQVFKDL